MHCIIIYLQLAGTLNIAVFCLIFVTVLKFIIFICFLYFSHKLYLAWLSIQEMRFLQGDHWVAFFWNVALCNLGRHTLFVLEEPSFSSSSMALQSFADCHPLNGLLPVISVFYPLFPICNFAIINICNTISPSVLWSSSYSSSLRIIVKYFLEEPSISVFRICVFHPADWCSLLRTIGACLQLPWWCTPQVCNFNCCHALSH